MALTSANRCSFIINKPPPGTSFEIRYKVGFCLVTHGLQVAFARFTRILNRIKFFIVIVFFFFAIFVVISTSSVIGAPRGFSLVNLPFPLTYCFYFISYFFSSFSVFWGLGLRELPTLGTIWPNLNVLIGQKQILVPLEVLSCLKVNFVEITVIAVRFMRCDLKFDLFLFYCVFWFNSEVTIYAVICI